MRIEGESIGASACISTVTEEVLWVVARRRRVSAGFLAAPRPAGLGVPCSSPAIGAAHGTPGVAGLLDGNACSLRKAAACGRAGKEVSNERCALTRLQAHLPIET